MRAALHQIEAEIANIDMPPAIDDHVVDGAGCDARKIDQRRELIVFEGEELPIEHRSDDGIAVGQKSHPTGNSRYFECRFANAIEAYRQNGPREAIHHPQLARMPARPLKIFSFTD